MKKKHRRDCFLGLHFDFHAMPGDSIGRIIDVESIEQMLDATRPDMIQVDTKGHPGISSYMTKAGVHPEEMNMDVLRVWRKLTRDRGILLYAHHSGLYDQTQAVLHPEWAVVSAEGEVSREYMSPFGPYVDEVLIPQILEIAGEYEADGIWVDGECWGAFVDYSEHARRAWAREYGTEVPYPQDGGYEDYREFCREGFRRYVTHYIHKVKEKYPDFEITSNWLYSHYMPEKRTIPVDFISGDYSCKDSVRIARGTARCVATHDFTWDLIAWGQNAAPVNWVTRNRCTKEAPQLCQEAAVVLALGGGFQFFNILYGTGGLVQKWAIPSWKEVAEFCREREKFCFHGESIADIAVMFPKHYGKNKLFTGGALRALRGWVSMVADAGLSCDVINEADLSKIDKYKVVIMPVAQGYEEETLSKITEFAKDGGTVIADGGVLRDTSISGATFDDGQMKLIFLDGGERLSALETNYYEARPTTAEKLLYCYEENYYYEEEKHTSCILNKVGNGKVVSLCFELGNVYAENITYALKQYVKRLFAACGYVSPISVEGSDYADVTLMKKDGKIMVNVINMAGEHNANGVRTFREIPAIGPLTVRIRTDKRPMSATWQPDGKVLELEESEDGYVCRIDKLDIHGIVEIEFANDVKKTR